MKRLIYDPIKSGKRMAIVCFVSGSGTNYREIVARDSGHDYLVFTNRPGCRGSSIARQNNHAVIELSHIPFLEDARKRYGAGGVPRNCPERVNFEQAVSRAIENYFKKEPDLICLAGYDQWLTDWMVDKYYPRILNVHPGDTTKGYDGLHWVPTAKAILAGDMAIKSTLFFVDGGEDTGPVLMQSRELDIAASISRSKLAASALLKEGLHKIYDFADRHSIHSYEHFKEVADGELQGILVKICEALQEELKTEGDWKIYPFAVHNLIAQGRVQVDGKIVFIDGKKLPVYGYVG